MNRRAIGGLVVLVLGSLVLICGFVRMAATEPRTGSVLPQFGLMRQGTEVTIVNLRPIRYARNISGSDQAGLWLNYGDRCFMRNESVLVAIGVDGQRVLVRSRQSDPGYLPSDGAPYCTEETLFWVGYQQFLLSAEAYRKTEQKKQTAETGTERDKRIIRKLLDDQLARK